MPYNNNHRVTLQQAPITFNSQYTPTKMNIQSIDPNILQAGLNQYEQRMNTMTNAKFNLDKELGELQEHWLGDSDSLKWLNDYKEQKSQEVQNLIDSGAIGEAGRRAVNLAGEILKDPTIKGRMLYADAYKKDVEAQKSRIGKDISQNTYNWWLKKNKVSYTDILDSNGKSIGVQEYQGKPLYASMDFATLALSAMKLITPDKYSTLTSTANESGSEKSTATSNTNNTSYDNQNIEGTGAGNSGHTNKSSSSRHSSSHKSSSSTLESEQHEKVNIDQIRATMEKLLDQNDGYSRIMQELEVAKDGYLDLEKQVEDLKAKADKTEEDDDRLKDLNQALNQQKELLFKNGSFIDYDEYYARMITDSLYAQNLAYDWRSTEKRTSHSNYTSNTSETSHGSDTGHGNRGANQTQPATPPGPYSPRYGGLGGNRNGSNWGSYGPPVEGTWLWFGNGNDYNTQGLF